MRPGRRWRASVVSPVWRVTVPVQLFRCTDGLCWDAAGTVPTGAEPPECGRHNPGREGIGMTSLKTLCLLGSLVLATAARAAGPPLCSPASQPGQGAGGCANDTNNAGRSAGDSADTENDHQAADRALAWPRATGE